MGSTQGVDQLAVGAQSRSAAIGAAGLGRSEARSLARFAALAVLLLGGGCGDRPRSPADPAPSVAFLAPLGPRSSSVERTEVRTAELVAVVRGLCNALEPTGPLFVPGAPVRVPERVERQPDFGEPLERALGSTTAGSRFITAAALQGELRALLERGGPLQAGPIGALERCLIAADRVDLSADESQALARVDLTIAGPLSAGGGRQIEARLRLRFTRADAGWQIQSLDLGRLEVTDYHGPHFVDVSRLLGVGLFRSSEKSAVILDELGSVVPSALGGLTVLDFDRDGWLDLLVYQRASSLLLFRNDRIGGFDRVALDAVLPAARAAAYYLFVDLDGDGSPELIGTEPTACGKPARLPIWRFKKGLLQEVGGVPLRVSCDDRFVHLTADDFDGDGDLDLLLVNHGLQRYDLAHNRADAMDGAPSRYFVNDGRLRFKDASAAIGLPSVARRSVGAFWVDYNGDGQRDLFLLNESAEPDLLLHQGQRLQRSLLPGPLGPIRSVVAADLNGDADLDLYFARTYSAAGQRAFWVRRASPLLWPRVIGGALMLSSGTGTSSEAAAALRVAKSGYTFGAVAADLDDDGDPELFLSNGLATSSKAPELDSITHDFRQLLADAEVPSSQTGKLSLEDARARAESNRRPVSVAGSERDLLYFNVGRGQAMVDVAYAAGLDAISDGRSVAAFDYDGDGDLDLALLSLQGLQIFENRGPKGQSVDLVLESKQGTLGALVEVASERSHQVGLSSQSSGFGASVPGELHFGLGNAKAGAVKVRWPSGHVDLYPGLSAGMRHVLVEGGRAEAEQRRRWPRLVEERALDAALRWPGPLVRLDGVLAVPPQGPGLSVLSLASTSCAACKDQVSVLKGLAGQGVQAVQLMVDQDLERAAAWVREAGVDYPAFRADGSGAALAAQPGGLPQSYVYSRGALVRAYDRPVSAAEVAAWPAAFRAVELAPGDAEVLAQRGVRLLETSKIDEALALLLQAIRLDPSNISAQTNVAVAYGAKGDWAEAIARGKAALSLRPEHLPAELNLAVALSASGAHGEAIAHYRRVIARQPRNRAAQFNLAVAYAATGQKAQARSLLAAWVKLAPVDREAKAMLERLEQPAADAKP